MMTRTEIILQQEICYSGNRTEAGKPSGHSDWLTTTTMQTELEGRFTIRALLLLNIIDLKFC